MGKRLLIIDDSKDILDLTKNLLELKGYEIKSSSDATNVFETIKAFQPNMILLDMVLEDENGAEICHNIKSNQETNKIPIVLTTGQTEVSEYFSEEMIRPEEILFKPFEFDDLLKLIEKYAT